MGPTFKNQRMNFFFWIPVPSLTKVSTMYCTVSDYKILYTVNIKHLAKNKKQNN